MVFPTSFLQIVYWANYCSQSHSCQIVIFDFISSDFKLLHLVRYWIISLQLVVPDHLYMNNEHCCSRSLFANCPYVLLLLRLSLEVLWSSFFFRSQGVKGTAVTHIWNTLVISLANIAKGSRASLTVILIHIFFSFSEVCIRKETEIGLS